MRQFSHAQRDDLLRFDHQHEGAKAQPRRSLLAASSSGYERSFAL